MSTSIAAVCFGAELGKRTLVPNVRRILTNKNAITSQVDSHDFERREKWRNQSNLLDELLRLGVLIMWIRYVYLTDTVNMEKGRRLKR